jgi:hypothetical protein
MNELVFWKPATKELLEQITMLGHEMADFDPLPPAVLPRDAGFSPKAECRRCGASLHVLWSPFDDEGLTAHGSALEDRCTSLRGSGAS